MLINKNWNKVFLLICFIFVMLPAFLILGNKINTENLIKLEDVSANFDVYDTQCFNKKDVINSIESSYTDNEYKYQDRDIYLSQNLDNIFCLGNVVNIHIEENDITIFIGSNQKVKDLASLSWLVFLSIFSLIKLEKKYQLVVPVIFMYYLTQLIVNNRSLSFIDLPINFLGTFMILLIGFLVFDPNTYEQVLLPIKKINKLFLKKSKELEINKSKYFIKNLNVFLLLIIFILGILKKLVYMDSKLIYNDQLIQVYTSAKMFFFNQTSFEAALNQHTPLIPFIYKHMYYIFDYKNFDIGVSFLGILLSLTSSLILYFVVMKILENNAVSLLVSTLFLVFNFNNNVLNRDLGILIFLIIILNIQLFEKTHSNKYLALIIFFSILQIYNLESFIFSIFLMNLYVIYIGPNRNKIISYYFISGSISLFSIYGSLIINGELSNLLKTNYLFHLQNINPEFVNTRMFKAIGYTPYSEINIKHLIFLGVIINLIITIKNKNLFERRFEFLIYGWFLVELVNLKITGPRFWNYGINLILPTLLIYVFILKKISKGDISNQTYSYILAFLFLVLFFSNSLINLINFQNHNNEINTVNLYTNNEQILKSIKYTDENPELVLTWIHPADWQWVFNKEREILPATKHWWWFFMKYHQTEMYIWDKNWNEDEIKRDFYADLELEQPKYAIVNIGIIEPPMFFTDLLDKFYITVYEDDSFKVLKRVNEIKVFNTN